MVYEKYLIEAIKGLRMAGISMLGGLSDTEVDDIQNTFGFQFPPDLLMLLRLAVPKGDGFPAWHGSYSEIGDLLQRPIDHICWDVEHNAHWRSSWGPRPASMAEALQLARHHLTAAPKLVPVYSHRYIPTQPSSFGNPVFSVYGTDVIYYGFDLPSYLAKEFGIPCPTWTAEAPRPVPFWDYYLDEIYEDNPNLMGQ